MKITFEREEGKSVSQLTTTASVTYIQVNMQLPSWGKGVVSVYAKIAGADGWFMMGQHTTWSEWSGFKVILPVGTLVRLETDADHIDGAVVDSSEVGGASGGGTASVETITVKEVEGLLS